MLDLGVIGLQSIDPFLSGGNGLGFGQVHQAQLGQLAGAPDGIGQLPAQLLGVHLAQGRLLMERSPLGRYAPDAPMGLVSVGVTERCLIMSDDRVEPVGKIDCAVGSHVQVDGTKGVVGGGKERGQGLQPVSGAIDGWAKTGDVAGVVTGDKEVALQVVGKMRRIDDLDAHRFDLGFPDSHGAPPVPSTDMVGVHQTGQQFTDTGAVALDE